MTGNILAAFSFVKTGIVQELCTCSAISLQLLHRNQGSFGGPFQEYHNEGFDTQNPRMSLQMTGGAQRAPPVICNDNCNFSFYITCFCLSSKKQKNICGNYPEAHWEWGKCREHRLVYYRLVHYMINITLYCNISLYSNISPYCNISPYSTISLYLVIYWKFPTISDGKQGQ